LRRHQPPRHRRADRLQETVSDRQARERRAAGKQQRLDAEEG
jgi:hypothetical protein